MNVDFLLQRFKENAEKSAIIWQNNILSYKNLLDKYEDALNFLKNEHIEKGGIVSLTGDFTLNSIVLILVLINNQNIIVLFNLFIKEGA